MISDSVPWREELAKVAVRVRKRATQTRWTERTGYLVERDLMTAMFSIRRLIESDKCSSRLPMRRLPVQLCAMTTHAPDWLERWSPWEHYDLDNVQPTELDVLSLAHQFVHSYILLFEFGEDLEQAGVIVGSDRAKRSHLYRVDLTTLLDLFEYVATEILVHRVVSRRDGSTKLLGLSQHDLVEAKLATYTDDEHEYVEFLPAADDPARVKAVFPELNDYPIDDAGVSWTNLYMVTAESE